MLFTISTFNIQKLILRMEMKYELLSLSASDDLQEQSFLANDHKTQNESTTLFLSGC